MQARKYQSLQKGYRSYHAHATRGALTLRRPRRSVKAPKPRPRSKHGARRLFLVALFLLAQAIFINSDLFLIHTVTIEGQQSLSEDYIREQLALPEQAKYWSTSLSNLHLRLSKVHQLAESEVKFVFPGRLEVDVVERQPTYRVAMLEAAPTYYDMDEAGMVLGKSSVDRSGELPKILVETPIHEGLSVSREMSFAVNESVRWLSGVFQPAPWFYTVDADHQVSLKTTFRGSTLTVKVGQIERMDYKVQVLELLLKKLVKQNKSAEEIDLRYSTPVVKLREVKGDKA